ncbi:MAG: hypothetical protein JSS14_27995 [Proteobacteria bacterium]|nr:hypothetical protein [Pseudomonadota bacterium]
MKDLIRWRVRIASGAIVAAAVLDLCEIAHAELAIAGFAVGQEVASCPAPSLPARNNDCDVGIACRFPKQSVLVFGTPAERVGFGTDPSGRIESVLASGIDAVQAAKAATEEFGAPDAMDGRNSVTNWGWLRAGVRLVITELADSPADSFAVLDRFPTGPIEPVCPPRPRRGEPQ